MKTLSLMKALLTLTISIVFFSVVSAQTLQKDTSPTIQIEVDKKIMDLVKSWDKRIWLFTSKDNPLKSFDSLQQKDIAAWGAELMEQVQAFYKVVAITEEGVRIIGTGNPIFSGMKNPPRLFITWSEHESQLHGAIRIKLKGKKPNLTRDSKGSTKKDPYNKAISDKAKNLALQLGLNPIGLWMDEKGAIRLVFGDAVFGANGLVLKENDMIINVGYRTFKFNEIDIGSGEYLTMTKGQLVKAKEVIEEK